MLYEIAWDLLTIVYGKDVRFPSPQIWWARVVFGLTWSGSIVESNGPCSCFFMMGGWQVSGCLFSFCLVSSITLRRVFLVPSGQCFWRSWVDRILNGTVLRQGLLQI